MIRLCGLDEKGIGPAFNLHKLPGKTGKALPGKGVQTLQGNAERQQPLLPVSSELPEYVAYRGVVNIREPELELDDCIIPGAAFCDFTVYLGRKR